MKAAMERDDPLKHKTHVSGPFLRWAGSKRQLLPRLRTFWRPEHKRYIEPFVGSAALFFELQPNSGVLGDLNPELIETFRQVRNRPRKVSEALRSFPRGKKEYYEIRSVDPKTLSPIEAAARFIYLNRFCFNGLFRTNLGGRFNVPYAPSGTGELPREERLVQCAKLLRRVELRIGDFADTLHDVAEGDFVYMDPPFAVQKRRIFREYCPGVFACHDLDRLGNLLQDIHGKGARFVVSYADCSEARRIFSSWHPRRVRTKRNIAGFSESRRYAYELIVTNADD